ncbi:shikimate dehydrogenase [Roseitranquillus sediminis]|uniref:shikimate dehydrogenase n=1 Tax=Roseitranquillus sediminis TaxID=2809051 RepID=UPI001D0CAA52|nr:shikimate dehydrogenase [Roseitranquillus sediminis]MBM9596230.1 shikimate dehydrogenase [Roseitranquillus sediminis]
MTSDRIPLAGVIGSPVAHSRSPALHNHWLRRLGLPGHYVPLDVNQANLRQVLAAMPKMGFVGCNVTIPHKETVLGLADLVTDRAALIGAANTLIFRTDGRIHADNTDGYGFVENLRHGAPDWDPSAGPAAVIGAGGAARAVIASLINLRVPELRIANRTRARADALRSEFGSRLTIYDWNEAGAMLSGASTVVNASSLGMAGKTEMRIPLDQLRSGMVVTDLVYTPLRTRFLEIARAAGCTTVDGLGMLIWQAAPGFERWFGMRPPIDEQARLVVGG